MRFARSRVPADHAYVHVVRLFDALVEVERSAAAGRRDDLASVNEAVDGARTVLEEVSSPRPGEARSLVDRLDDARVAARILRARLSRNSDVPEAEASEPRSEGTEALARRLDCRRLLSLLRARPGKIISAGELAVHVWPAENLDEPAARARVDALITSTADDDANLGDGVRAAAGGYVLAGPKAR